MCTKVVPPLHQIDDGQTVTARISGRERRGSAFTVLRTGNRLVVRRDGRAVPWHATSGRALLGGLGVGGHGDIHRAVALVDPLVGRAECEVSPTSPPHRRSARGGRSVTCWWPADCRVAAWSLAREPPVMITAVGCQSALLTANRVGGAA